MKTKIFLLLVSLIILSFFYFGCPHPIAPVADNENLCKKVAIPLFSPEQGNYETAQSVTISCSTKGTVIRYTTNGDDPVNNSTVYTNPITVDTSMTIKAIAYRSRWKDSNIAIAVYTIGKTVAAPVFTPAAGIYSTVQNVEISCSTADATIRYTTNGTDPDENSTEYTEPVIVDSTTTIKAKAFKTDYTNSAVSESVYTFLETVAAPSFSLSSGTYNTSQSLEISCATADAVIRYTTNGSDPEESSTQYTAAINVNISMTVKAKAYKTGCIESSISSAEYVLKVASPTMNYPTSYYTTNMEIIISSATPDATIKFTVDGSDPKTSETAQIGNSYTLTRTITLNAYAYKAGWTNSETTSATYTYIITAPAIYPVPQAFDSSFICTITCISAGATIKYTTDGTDPKTSSTATIGNTFTISQPTTVKAYAYKEGCIDSDTGYQIYTFKVKMPVITPNSGSYASAQTVNITCETASSTIKYTTDGTDPKTSSTAVIGSTLLVNTSKTVKAFAYRTGFTSSETVTASYIIDNVPSTIAYRDLAYVPGGTIIQGDTFQNTISPYFLAKYEVTYELWYTVRIWAMSNGYKFLHKGSPSNNDSLDGTALTETNKYKPVCNLTRMDGLVWCNAYSEMSGLSPCYLTSDGLTAKTATFNFYNYECDLTRNGYKMPTEGEWELAARYIDGTNWTPTDYATKATTFHNDARDLNMNGIYDGKETNDLVAVYGRYWNGSAWCNTGVTDVANVGSKAANHLGLYDISGNVSEHCYDYYDIYPTSPQTNYFGAWTQTYYYIFILRGGGMYVYADNSNAITTGLRYTYTNGTIIDNIGLRVSRKVQ